MLPLATHAPRGRMLSALLACALLAAGCRAPQATSLRSLTIPLPDGGDLIAEAQRHRESACRLEAQHDERCVDAYFAATRLLAVAIQNAPDAEAWSAYHQNLADLLRTGHASGRLDARVGLRVESEGRSVVVPVVHHGFPWLAADFQRLDLHPPQSESLLKRWYCLSGWGVPVVVERCRDEADPLQQRFAQRESAFAATVLLRADEAAGGAVLEFFDPLRVVQVQRDCGTLPLAFDKTAALAAGLKDSPRTYFAGFVQPESGQAAARLEMLEPYQPGRVPVVIVHGLFSDPESWADLINDLRASPGFSSRFQLWTFRYPTGQGFLRSAAELRKELLAAVALLDPEGHDPALRRMVLVGHSMGGLISKLQVTSSEDQIWNRVANRPLEAIVTSDEVRQWLAKLCFFEPVPHVRRVVFIATPHQGSSEASGLIGRAASKAVRQGAAEQAQHDQLIRDNPGVFADFVQEEFPTSVDLLRPNSPLLAVMRTLPLSCDVALHNILGEAYPLTLNGPSDGVVPATSAFHPGCQSVLKLNAKHGVIHRNPQTSAELLRLLEIHIRECGR